MIYYYVIYSKVLLTAYIIQLCHNGHLFIFNVSNAAKIGYIFRLTLLGHEFEQFGVTANVCTKEKYRPQRDSNLVLPCTDPPMLPMSYTGISYHVI